jgi:hypothetical protein
MFYVANLFLNRCNSHCYLNGEWIFVSLDSCKSNNCLPRNPFLNYYEDEIEENEVKIQINRRRRRWDDDINIVPWRVATGQRSLKKQLNDIHG